MVSVDRAESVVKSDWHGEEERECMEKGYIYGRWGCQDIRKCRHKGKRSVVSRKGGDTCIKGGTRKREVEPR